MRRVFIAEKPDTARASSPFLQPGEIVLPAEGHLPEPKEPDESCDKRVKRLPDTLPIVIEELPLKVARNRSGRLHTDKLDAIAKALRAADVAVIATDSGREGSLSVGRSSATWTSGNRSSGFTSRPRTKHPSVPPFGRWTTTRALAPKTTASTRKARRERTRTTAPTAQVAEAEVRFLERAL